MAAVDFYQNQQQADGQNQNPQATAGIPGKDDERKLFVGGLSRNTTENELREHFGKFGEIESVSVKIDPYTGVSRGFAFMVFTNPKTIDKLLASGDHYINKRKVSIKMLLIKHFHFYFPSNIYRYFSLFHIPKTLLLYFRHCLKLTLRSRC